MPLHHGKAVGREDYLYKEHETLDDHDDRIADFIGRLQVLIEIKDDEFSVEATTSTSPLGKQQTN